MLFGKRKRSIEVNGKTIELEPPRKGIGSLFRNRARMTIPTAESAEQQAPSAETAPGGAPKPAREKPTTKRDNLIKSYLKGMESKHKGLEAALREQNIKESAYEFIKRMVIA